jgi:hypothetical protein
MTTHRIAVQVLNGATGEVREIVANVHAVDDQHAVNILFDRARRDDYYYRFLGWYGVVSPTDYRACAVEHEGMTYWALEE